ncbi:MAG: hypothetical protein AMXMBFR7_19250 [Planctomycetota bacterium]
MSELALQGGKPVYDGAWPAWPVRDQREVERLVRVARRGNWGFNGPEDAEFRAAFGNFLGVRYGFCVTNGTHALQLALEALDVGAGDEVIVPGLTWQATAACALDVNAVPILVDIDPQTLTMDPAALRAAITPRTKAIIPVHLYGCMANLDEILAVANEFGIPVIEDGSHQHGSEWRGRKAGTWGKLAAFSLQASKVLNAGEGGYVCTGDEKLARRLDALRHCGRAPAGCENAPPGEVPQSGNFRISEFQAAVLNAQLSRLPEQTERRDENAQYLSKLLREIPGLDPLARLPQVTRQAYYAYGLRYRADAFGGLPRKRVQEALKAELGIEPGYTYQPLNHSPLYKPQTKRRHRLSEEYWRAIDPQRFELPQCTRAAEEIMLFSHTVLLAEREHMARIAEAFAKVRAHAEALRATAAVG